MSEGDGYGTYSMTIVLVEFVVETLRERHHISCLLRLTGMSCMKKRILVRNDRANVAVRYFIATPISAVTIITVHR